MRLYYYGAVDSGTDIHDFMGSDHIPMFIKITTNMKIQQEQRAHISKANKHCRRNERQRQEYNRRSYEIIVMDQAGENTAPEPEEWIKTLAKSAEDVLCNVDPESKK